MLLKWVVQARQRVTDGRVLPILFNKMQDLLVRNSYCADCSTVGVQFVDMNHGAFLCHLCSEIHRRYGFQVRNVMDIFDDREVRFLQDSGNDRVNDSLLQIVPVWITRPKQFNYP